MLDIACSQCGAIYHADLAHLGKRLRCTQCGSIVLVENTQLAGAPPKASPAQPQPYSRGTVPKPRSRWAIYLGASALIASLFVVTWWLGQPQVHLGDQQNEVRSGTTQQNAEGHSEEPNSTPRNTPPDAGQSVVSNPFSTAPQGGPNLALTGHDKSSIPNRTNLDSNQSHAKPSAPKPEHYYSLPTGTRLSDDIGVGGHGKLSISNPTDLDAVVRLYNSYTLETMRWFFVKANSSCTVESIPQGDYRLAYTLGLDWVDSEDAFRWNPSYYELEKTVGFSEQREADVIQHISVTIHPVVGGNVPSKSISRADFLKGHRHVPSERQNRSIAAPNSLLKNTVSLQL